VSVNVIAELHPLRSGRTKLSVNSKPIADIIRELNTGFPPSQARVCRNGEIVKDFSITAEDGDTLWVKFVPYGGRSPEDTGRGMKAGGAALMLAGIVIGIATSWTGVGAMFGVMLIGSGIGMLAGGAALMNINIPSFKDREKPENDPSIRGGKNQSRPHGRIPVLFGRHRIYPDLAANPHTEIIGNAQYFTQLFCGGYKDCVIDLDSLKLGDTPLVDMSHTKNINLILAGADPLVRLEIIQDGRESALYPYCVHEDMINAELKQRVEDGAGNKISGEIIRDTPDNTDTINVDIFFYNGLGKYNDKGDLKPTGVEVRVSYKNAGDDSPYQPLGFLNNNTNAVSGAELKTKRYQITKKGLAPGAYKVKIERVTPDSSDSKIIDQVHVGSIRSIKSASPILAERRKDLTIIALRVMATARVSGIVDSFNYIATSKLPAYSGGSHAGNGELYWLNAAETRNPAAMLLYALRGRAAQQQVDPADIDWASLEAFYQWCAEHGYFCDAYLSESVTIAELLRMIGGTSRAEVLRIDSKISVVQDIERPSPVQLFTPKNTKSYSAAMFNADIPDAVSLRYIDEESGYAQGELSVHHTPDGNPPAGKSPETIQKIDLWGVTNSQQVRRIGMYNYACLKNRPFVHTIEVDIEYLLCNKGDRIQYAGDLTLTGSVQGRITGMLRSEDAGRYVGIRVDEPVETAAGGQYAVRLRLSDGTVLLKDVATIRQPNEIYFTEPFEADYAPAAGDIYAFGIRGREVADLIITDIQPQADLSAALTCVEYSPAIFDVDDPNFVLPEFENKITPVSGAIDSGVVGPTRWRLFVTYHDSEMEPPRPSGDGQGGDWHYAHTSRSFWQSSKTAETVDSGEWGPPVRIKGERDTGDVIPVYLTLSPQNVILECDSGGAVLAGLLPLTVRAELFKWSYKIPVDNGIMKYPGNNADLFDPMLGDFFPAGRNSIFSLADAPRGVTIDQEGVITVAADADLEDEHSITVRAVYQGDVYAAILFIQVKKRVGEERYLGTIETLPSGPDITIIKGPFPGRVRALQGHYVLAVASGTVGSRIWKAGYVYQWNGVSWQERSPANYSALYISCFKDGLEAPELTQDMGWFGAVFAGLIVAQNAFIENLAAQVITLRNTGLIKSDNYIPGLSGFILPSNGKAVFNDELFAYNLKVVNFEIIPPTNSSDVLIKELVGYLREDIIIGIGWYKVELAGGGGGAGGSYNSVPGGGGGEGGYVTHVFYNNRANITVSLASGSGGGNGLSRDGGGGGGGSSIKAILLNLLVIAGGGGGGGGGANGGGGGGGGADGFGGRGSGGAGSAGGGGWGDATGGNGTAYNGGKAGVGGDGALNIGGKGGGGGAGDAGGGGRGFPGGCSINGIITANTGGGNNANGGSGYARLYKLG